MMESLYLISRLYNLTARTWPVQGGRHYILEEENLDRRHVFLQRLVTAPGNK